MAGKETVKGTFGNEPIELTNAASEATLNAMLKIAQKDSAVLAAMAKQAGLDAKKIEEALEGQSGGDKGKGMGLLGGAANLAGGFLMDMVGSIGKTIGNLANFSQSLMDGTARASDFFKAFSGLPLGLGLVADALAFAQKFMEKNVDTYRAISQTGAGLSSSLVGLRSEALNLGLSMDELAAMFQRNQRALGVLGGSSMNTAKNLVGINTQLVNSNMGRNLAGLGYSFAEINGLIGDYLAVTADGIRIGHNSGSEQRRLAKAAGEYGKELDFLARLTGESREATQKKIEADNQEASWQLYLTSLGPDMQKQATEAINRARLQGGKGGVDYIKSMFMGFAGPFSAEGQFFASTMHTGAQSLKDMVAVIKSGQPSEIVNVQLNKLFAKGMAGNIKDLDKFRLSAYAAGQGGADSAKGFLELAEAQKNFRAQRKFEEADILESIINTQKKAAADAAATKSQTDADLAMKRLGAQLTNALLPALTKLSEVGLGLITRFTTFISREGVMAKIETAATVFANYIENLFSAEGRNKILADFSYLLERMLIEIKYKLNYFYSKGDRKEDIEQADRVRKLATLEADEVRLKEKKKELDTKILKMQGVNLEQEQRIIDAEKIALQQVQDKAAVTEIEKAQKRDQIKLLESEIARHEELLEIKSDKKNEALVEQVLAVQSEILKTEQEKKKMAELVRNNGLTNAQVDKKVEDMQNNAMPPTMQSHATGTLGSGKMIRDFGRETLSKLHGREAVLTEDQLTNMAKGIQQSSPQINLDSLDMLAEGIITLNRATAMQNKILGTMVENQRTMINRATGNRLMA
jgi:hypothetical protein